MLWITILINEQFKNPGNSFEQWKSVKFTKKEWEPQNSL